LGCPTIDCDRGFTLVAHSGACCPVCTPDAEACSSGQAGYSQLRQQLLKQAGALACVKTSDCTALAGDAFCGGQCLAIPVGVAAAPAIQAQLATWAKAQCSTCTPTFPGCNAMLKLSCVAGECALAAP